MTMRNRDQENSHNGGKTMGNTVKNQSARTRLKQYMRTFLFEVTGYLCSSVILGLWLLFIAWLLLSGCSTTSETFDCKEGKGVGRRRNFGGGRQRVYDAASPSYYISRLS
jgi:hypothetical protein